MCTHRTAHLLSLLVFIPFSTLGQKMASSEMVAKGIDLSDKTFIMVEKATLGKAENDLNLYLIFCKGGKAVFRVKRGDLFTKDNLLSWRLVGDSLYVQNSPIELIADGKTQLIDREPVKYAIEKVSSGYLLKERDSHTFWIELK